MLKYAASPTNQNQLMLANQSEHKHSLRIHRTKREEIIEEVKINVKKNRKKNI